jgi:hypothetical protein
MTGLVGNEFQQTTEAFAGAEIAISITSTLGIIAALLGTGTLEFRQKVAVGYLYLCL